MIKLKNRVFYVLDKEPTPGIQNAVINRWACILKAWNEVQREMAEAYKKQEEAKQ